MRSYALVCCLLLLFVGCSGEPSSVECLDEECTRAETRVMRVVFDGQRLDDYEPVNDETKEWLDTNGYRLQNVQDTVRREEVQNTVSVIGKGRYVKSPTAEL